MPAGPSDATRAGANGQVACERRVHREKALRGVGKGRATTYNSPSHQYPSSERARERPENAQSASSSHGNVHSPLQDAVSLS